MNERKSIIIRLFLTHLLPAPVLIIVSWLIPDFGLILTIITETIFLITVFTGYREFFTKTFQFFYAGSIQILLIFDFIKQFSLLHFDNNLIISIMLLLIECYLILTLLKILRVIFGREKENIEITFPFKSGKYLVTDGGNSRVNRLMNYHFHSKVHKKRGTNQSMLYATDLVKTDNQKNRFLPPKNENYPIFGENLYCPMDGTIVKVSNDIDDNQPFSGNYPYNTGNTIVIKNGNYYLLTGHLKKGSIIVKEGDSVFQNDLLAQCGNSGMSERPHLHMQLMKCYDQNYWKGTGVNMIYKGINLYKNRQIEIKGK